MTRLASIVFAGLLLLGVVGCSSNSSSHTTAPTTTSTTSIASTLKQGDVFVALGSSIASGVGIPEQSHCFRSTRNYPHLVAAKYGLKLIDVTCAGAVIRNVLDTPQGDDPPQISAVTQDTKLITVSVGGNDIPYFGTALACGNPNTVCTRPATLDADLAALPGKLKTMISALKTRAPSATIVFVTDPREIPPGNCPAMSFTDDEAALLRGMGDKLEATFVDVVKGSGVVFVDPYVAPGDHTGCASQSERWAAGHEGPDGFPYHPTALGHQVMADLIVKALGG